MPPADSVERPVRQLPARRRRVLRPVATAVLTAVTAGLGLVTTPAAAAPFAYELEHVAGTGVSGTPTTGPATASPLGSPTGVAVDSSGNRYVADTANHVVRRIDTAGQVTVVAGDGTSGATANGVATAVHLNQPTSVSIGRYDRLYIADAGNRQVYLVDPSSSPAQLTRVAGSGAAPAGATPGQAALTQPFRRPGIVAADSNDVYVVDQDDFRIWHIDGNGDLEVVAGTGTSGPPTTGANTAVTSQVGRVTSLQVSGGKKVFADDTNCVVMTIDNAQTFGIAAGDGTCGPVSTAGAATATPLTGPRGATMVGANVFFTDGTRVYQAEGTTTLSVISGTGSAGQPVQGPALSSPLTTPGDVLADPTTTSDPVLYVLDRGTHRLVRLVPQVPPTVQTNPAPPVARVGRAFTHTFALQSGTTPVTWSVTSGSLPAGLTLDSGSGVLSGTPRASGTASYTVAATSSAGVGTFPVSHVVLGVYALAPFTGTGTAGAPVAGPATSSPLGGPAGMAVDGAGNVFVVDGTSAQVVRVTPAGQASVVSTAPVPLVGPTGVAVDGAGNLFVADPAGAQVVRVPVTGTPSVVAGTGTSGTPTQGTATSVQLSAPSAVAVLGAGSAATLFVADSGAHRVLAVSMATQQLTYYAGTGTAGSPVAFALATGSPLDTPSALAVSGTGELYIADSGAHVVVLVDVTGGYMAVAGDGTAGAPTSGSATGVHLDQPAGLAFDPSGVLWVTDGRRVVQVFPGQYGRDLAVVAGSGTTGAPVAGLALSSPLSTTAGIAISGTGVAHVVDRVSNLVVRLSPTELPAVTSAVPIAATTAVPYSHTFTATGTAPLTWAVTSGAPPAGLVLSSSGVLSGTATTAGTTSFTVTASNLGGTAAQVVALVVAAPPAPGSTPTLQPPSPPAPGVTRLQGPDRTATAVAVSTTLFPQRAQTRAAVVATSSTFADGIGGAGLASALGGPLLFTSRDTLDAATAAEIRRVVRPGGALYLLGGTSAVSAEVEAALRATGGYTVTRLGGADRYATSVKIAELVATEHRTTQPPVYLASGRDFPDALSVAALAAHSDGVVLLTAGATVPDPTRDYLDRHDPDGALRTTTVGGPAAAALPSAHESLAGRDRYATAALVAGEFGPQTRSFGVASGADWPDALVGAAAMGIVDGPLLLTPPGGLDPSVTGWVSGRRAVGASWLFGGTSAAGSSVEADLGALLAAGR